jgi:TetR/AcrR family transcriptional repressor of nem operon
MARKKEFDREEVLDRAVEAFWCKGYEATSVQDLLDGMGINRGSLYDTFGDKHALFLAAIDRYYDRALARTIETLETARSARDGLERVVLDAADCGCEDRQRKGCLMTNSAVELAPHCLDTAERVAHYYRQTEDALCRAVARARAEGRVHSRLDDRALARFISCGIQGLQVCSKVSPDREILRDAAEGILSALG